MRECSCDGQNTCYSCQHLKLHEKLPTGHNQHTLKSCHPNARLGVNRETGGQFGGCHKCWSKTVYRWHCSLCRYRSAWIEDNVAYDEEVASFRSHA